MSGFELLLQSAKGIQLQSLSEKTRGTYKYLLARYETIMREIDGAPNPFPLTEDKCMAFLEHMRLKGITYSYLKSFVATFANYFKEHNIFDFTKTFEFRKYKDGLMKTMKGGSCPNAKEPITSKMLDQISAIIDQSDRLQLRDMAMYTMMFYGFLRFNECANLKPEDIFTEIDGKLRIVVRFSKTDPTGVGEDVYLYPSYKYYCAIKWYLKYLSYCERHNMKFNFAITPSSFKRRLDLYLSQIEIEHPLESYGGHSFRRGGAYAAALFGIQDCNIKAHGRWKSAVYTKYTAVQMIEAGQKITVSI